MKISKIKKVLVALLFMGPVLSYAGSFEGDITTRTAQALDYIQVYDMTGIRRVSMQATYVDGTPSGTTNTTGSRSTGSITVSNFSALAEKKAQITITVSSNTTTALTGAVLNFNGALFRQGIEWAIGASSIATGKNISDAIEAHSGYQSTHTLSVTAVVTASASTAGSFANTFSVTSSTPTALVLSAATLLGGQDNATIVFGNLGVTLTQGSQWTAAGSNAQTASSIEDAIGANSILTSVFIATNPTGTSVVFGTVTQNGNTPVYISVSTPALILSNGVGLLGGTTSAVTIASDLFTSTPAFNTFTTGLKVLYSTASTNVIGGLTNQTTYFVIRVNDSSYKLATSSTNAAAGTAIDITSLPLTSVLYSLTPPSLSLAVNNGFFWQASNDGTNFGTFTYAGGTAVSSVTYSAPGTTLWDFGELGYKYLRTVFTGPTNGAIGLKIRQYGKDN